MRILNSTPVFLAPTTNEEDPTSLYPSSKIADFGLARIVSSTTNNDRAYNMQRGTKKWLPPEIRIDQMGCPWQFAPSLNTNADKSAHVITTQSNLFALAAIIWSFMTGREINDLDEMIYDKICRPVPPKTPYVDPEIKSGGRMRTNKYSAELSTLVRDCLKIQPNNRPALVELRNRVRQGLQKCMAREEEKHSRDPGATVQNLKMYFHANDINEAPPGQAQFKLDNDFWRRFASATLFVPEEWGALLPPTAPSNWEPSQGWPPEIRRRWLENLKRARERKRRREDAPQLLEPPRKRQRVRAALRNIKNAVSFLGQPLPNFKVLPQKVRASPPEVAETPAGSSSSESSSADDQNNGFRRLALGGLVNPMANHHTFRGGLGFHDTRSSSPEWRLPIVQIDQPGTTGQKRPFQELTPGFVQNDPQLTGQAPPPTAQQGSAVQPLENDRDWKAGWMTPSNGTSPTLQSPPPPTRPQRRAHVKKDRRSSRPTRNTQK